MSFVSDFFKDITGRTARDAATKAGDLQSQAGLDAAASIGTAGDTAQGFFSPFQQVGQQGLEQSGFLGNSQAQFDFLQNNPLFQLALDNANEQTKFGQSASGRLSAGDTSLQLANNVLLSASPLIDRQRQDILNQLNFGQGIAGQQAGISQNTAANQANLTTGAAAAQAGGIVGGANAMGAGVGNLLNLGGAAFSAFGNPFASATPPVTSAISADTLGSGAGLSGGNLFPNPFGGG